MNKNNLPENLYELRKASGISQEEFAEKLGVSRQAVSKWERGEAYPDTENLIAISELFCVTIDSLLNNSAVSEEKENDGEAIHTENSADESNSIHTPEQREDEDEDEDIDEDDEEAHRGTISVWYSVPYPIITTVAFLAIGLLAHGWDWAWTLFITIPVYYSLLDCIHKRRLTEFAYPVFVTFLYCLFGMLFSWWHPGWLMFITIPIYYPIAEAIDRLIKRNTP